MPDVDFYTIDIDKKLEAQVHCLMECKALWKGKWGVWS